MNRTKKITLKHKAKTKKAQPRNGNKPVYVSKAEREALAAPEEAVKLVKASQD